MKWEAASAEDREIIEQQIERTPRNLSGIARRCPRQCPQVVVNHPLPESQTDAVFFPTVFWLTCPAVIKRISRIEDRGYIAQIQASVTQSRDFYLDLQDAHLEYIYLRNSLLQPAQRLELRRTKKKLAQSLEQSGIGGVADLGSIKCLHTHYAHFLATRRNPVGRLVDKMLALIEDPRDCKRCRAGSEADQGK